MSPSWSTFLAAHGIEAIHWAELGKASASDREIMVRARTEGYVVFTHDLDFGALLASASDTQPSVVQVRGQDILPEAIGATVLATLRSLADYLDSGALITIDLRRSRVRLLPIRKAN